MNVRGEPHQSLRLIARTLPVAHKHELYLRTNLLYRLAAASYQDLGQPRRSAASQRKAIALASTLGLPQFEATSWSRLAEYERIAGNFGNTLRYLEKARRIIEESTYEADRARLSLTMLHIHLWLSSPQLDKAVQDAAWIKNTKDVNQRGRYFMLLGMYCAAKRDWERASHYYERADGLLQRTGYMDYLMVLRCARLRLALQMGLATQSENERLTLESRGYRGVPAPTSQLERMLALLEFAFNRRMSAKTLHKLADMCLQVCDESTEAMTRLEAFLLTFRVFARNGQYDDAEAVLARFNALLKAVLSNLDEVYVPGFVDRLGLSTLLEEHDAVERKKAGVTASLVA